MPRKYLPWFLLLAVVVVVLGVWVGSLLYRLHSADEKAEAKNSPYSIVYLQTGDIYYGKLHWWPKMYIENPWYLIRNAQTGETNLAPFSSTFSGPSSKMYLNPKQVVWWSALRADSQVAKGLDGAANISLPEGQAPQQ